MKTFTSIIGFCFITGTISMFVLAILVNISTTLESYSTYI